MKKTFIFISIILSFLLLCSCGKPEPAAEIVQVVQEKIQEPEKSEEGIREDEMTLNCDEIIENTEDVIVKINNYVDYYFDPEYGEHLILSYYDSKPVIYIEDKDDVSSKINETLGLIDESYYTGSEYGSLSSGLYGFNLMLQLAEDNYTVSRYNSLNNEEFVYSRHSEVSRIGGGMITVVYKDYQYCGNEKNETVNVYNFSTETGEFVSISDYANNIDALFEMFAEKTGIEDTAPVFESFNDQKWGGDNSGLYFYIGQDRYHFKYEDIDAYINNEYKIASASDAVWNIHFDLSDDVPDSEKNIIDMVSLTEKPDAENILLSIEGIINNPSIGVISYSDGKPMVTDVWYCNRIENSAIQLLLDASEGLPTASISYTDENNEKITMFICISGADRAISLVDENISVLG